MHNGRVVKRTRDGALVEFCSVVEAVRWAIEVQVRKIIHLQFIFAMTGCRWPETLGGKP